MVLLHHLCGVAKPKPTPTYAVVQYNTLLQSTMAAPLTLSAVTPCVTGLITSLALAVVCARVVQPATVLLAKLRTFRVVVESQSGLPQLATLDISASQAGKLANVATLESLALLGISALVCVPLSTVSAREA